MGIFRRTKKEISVDKQIEVEVNLDIIIHVPIGTDLYILREKLREANELIGFKITIDSIDFGTIITY